MEYKTLVAFFTRSSLTVTELLISKWLNYYGAKVIFISYSNNLKNEYFGLMLKNTNFNKDIQFSDLWLYLLCSN
jgi:hypothetical protein